MQCGVRIHAFGAAEQIPSLSPDATAAVLDELLPPDDPHATDSEADVSWRELEGTLSPVGKHHISSIIAELHVGQRAVGGSRRLPRRGLDTPSLLGPKSSHGSPPVARTSYARRS